MRLVRGGSWGMGCDPGYECLWIVLSERWYEAVSSEVGLDVGEVAGEVDAGAAAGAGVDQGGSVRCYATPAYAPVVASRVAGSAAACSSQRFR